MFRAASLLIALCASTSISNSLRVSMPDEMHSSGVGYATWDYPNDFHQLTVDIFDKIRIYNADISSSLTFKNFAALPKASVVGDPKTNKPFFARMAPISFRKTKPPSNRVNQLQFAFAPVGAALLVTAVGMTVML